MDEPLFEMPPSLEPVRDWWDRISLDDCAQATAKLAEYGSRDLVEIGRTMAHSMPYGPLTDAHYAELGVYFYLIGKMARATEAIRRGDLPSEDTLHDITVYSMMWRRIRETGAWQ